MKQIPKYIVQCSQFKHSMLNQGYTESQINNYMVYGIPLNQTLIDRWSN